MNGWSDGFLFGLLVGMVLMGLIINIGKGLLNYLKK